MDDPNIKIVGLTSPKMSPSTKGKIVGAIIGVFVLVVGVGAGIYLVSQNQNPQEKASGNCDNPRTIVQCPAPDGNLYSCNPPDQNNNAQISTCDVKGRVELCGIDNNVVQYCCPSPNGAWTTDMTACSCQAKAPTSLTVTDLTSTSVTLKWVSGSGGITRLWVSKDSDPTGTCASNPSNCLVNDQHFDLNVNEYALSNLTPVTKYYWRLMTANGEGCDNGTLVANFTTAQTSTSTPSPTATSVATATATTTAVSSTKTPTPTPTKTATPTAKPTSSATATSKATATSTSTTKATATSTSVAAVQATATAAPIPVTGASWPTIIGGGFGIVMILVSIALAL